MMRIGFDVRDCACATVASAATASAAMIFLIPVEYRALKGIDTHAHVFSRDAPSVPGARYRPDYAATLERWQSFWPAAGITHWVLVQPSFFGTDNREMLDALARQPAKLRGVAVVAPSIDAGEIARLHALGVRAVRLNLHGVNDFSPYRAAAWTRLLDRIAARGWHLEAFVNPGRAPDLLAALDETAIALVLDHFGNPGATFGGVATFAAASRRARDREVWCKLSAPYRLAAHDPKTLAARWLDTLGPDRLLWGSDWPFTNHESEGDYAWLRAALGGWLDERSAARVLWDNAARLYDLS